MRLHQSLGVRDLKACIYKYTTKLVPNANKINK